MRKRLLGAMSSIFGIAAGALRDQSVGDVPLPMARAKPWDAHYKIISAIFHSCGVALHKDAVVMTMLQNAFRRVRQLPANLQGIGMTIAPKGVIYHIENRRDQALDRARKRIDLSGDL